MARRGLFSRFVSFIREIFTGGAGEEEQTPPRPPVEPPRRSDPYLHWWDYEIRGERTGYMNHRDIIDDMAFEYDLSEEDKQELWRDYLHYMVSKRSHFRRNDIRNPFWQKWGIDPDNFDWHAWREAMGYPHGGRR